MMAAGSESARSSDGGGTTGLDHRILALRRRLTEVEARKASIDRRQDDIDTLALRTIDGMRFLEARMRAAAAVASVEER